MSLLRIAINALYLIPGGVGGTEIYLRQLVRAIPRLGLDHEFVVYTNRQTPADLVPSLPHWTHSPLPVDATFRPGRLFYEQVQLPAILRRDRIDVLLNAGFTAPAFPGIPQATVFFDLQHKRQPKNFRWFDLPFWRLFLWTSAQRSDALIAISEPVRKDLLHFYGLSQDRVHTAWLGADERMFSLATHASSGSRILLCPSTTHPHKNHARLLRVFKRLLEELPGWRLVLTGVRGFANELVTAAVNDCHLEEHVELKGWVPREELYRLFAAADAFIYPSRFEGFGLPVVEALAAGLPVACSNIEPLKTLAGDAAVLFDPDDDDSMLAALRTVASHEEARARLREAGPAQARKFSWENTARETVRVLESIQRR